MFSSEMYIKWGRMKEFSDVVCYKSTKKERCEDAEVMQIKSNYDYYYSKSYASEPKRMIMLEFSLWNPIFSSIKQKFHIFLHLSCYLNII